LLSVDLPFFDHTPSRVLLKTFKRHYISSLSKKDPKALGFKGVRMVRSTR